MKFRDFLPPAFVAAFSGVRAKAFSTLFGSAFIHGDDLDQHAKNRLVQPYAQSAWVHAAVNHIVGEIASRPLHFYAGDQPYDEPAFAAWWEAPALGPRTSAGVQPRLSRIDVQRDLAAWAKLEGEFFLCFDDSWLLAGLKRNPAGLSPFLIAAPHRIRLILQGGEIQAYEYTDTAGRRTLFLPEQVLHWKAFNPYDEFRGIGALKCAQVAAEGAFLTGVYVRDLMRNNGDQGFIVVAKSGVVTDPQREQIVADLRAKRLALRNGIARDIFVQGDISIDRPTEQAASTDLNVGKALSHQEVFVAFGVPPSMAEVKASYSIGKDSDYYQLIIRTCQPLGGQIAAVLGKIAARMTGKPLTAELEWDNHPVMVDVRNSRIDAALKLWGTGMAWEEINEYLDLGMQAFDGWDIGYLPFSVAPVGTDQPAIDPAADPAMGEDMMPEDMTPAEEADNPCTEDDAVKSLRLLLLARSRSRARPVCQSPAAGVDEFAAFACECHGAAGVAQRADRPPRDIARWRDYISKRRGTVKSFQSALGRVLMKARIETLKKIETWHKSSLAAKPPGAVEKSGAVAHLLFDLAHFSDELMSALGAQQRAGLETAGTQLFAEVGKDDPFKYPPSAVLDYLAGRKNRLSGVPQEIYDRLKEQLEEGYTAGDTADELASRVKSTFNGIADGSAKRIALTETSAVYGAGRDEAMRQAGVQYKAWLTSGNANVRAAHQVAGEEYSPENAIPTDEPFVVDGEDLMFPGDDAGSAANVINCHCVSIAVAAPGADS